MKKECEHHYWSPMEELMLCYKCGKKVTVYPARYYSIEEFRKMYPDLKSGKIIFSDDPSLNK